MSSLTYNGITLELVATRMIGRDAVYDQSGSDLLYIRWSFDVDAVYNPAATSYIDNGGGPVATPGTMPAATDKATLEKLLGEPRKPLVYTNGGVMMLQSPPPATTVDAYNGPKPTFCHVRQIYGSKTFLISYRIETYVSSCESPEDRSFDPVLSNRYEVHHDIDDQRMTTIQTNGVAQFRMDALSLSPTGNADHFRSKCLPPIPIGFQRKRIRATVNAVGNLLVWSCIDQEMFYSLGNPNKYGVEHFEAIFGHQSNPVDIGGTQSIFDMESLDVHVVGSKNSSKDNLLEFALTMAIERLGLKANPVTDQDALIRSVSIQEQIHNRIVDFRITTQVPPAKNGIVGLGAVNGIRLGVDLLRSLANNGQNPQMPNDNNSRGSYVGEAFAAALQVACSAIEPVKSEPGQVKGNSYTPMQTYDPPYVETSVVPDLAKQITKYSQETTNNGLYTEYRVQARWKNDQGVRMMPVAGRRSERPVFLQLYAPVKKIQYTWTVERNGNTPKLPSPIHNDQRMILLESNVEPSEIHLAPDGQTSVYRVAGQYTYGLDIAGDEDFEITYPTVPWTDFRFGNQTIDISDYSHGIIDGPYVSNGGSPHDGDPPLGSLPGDPTYPTDPSPGPEPTPSPTKPANPGSPHDGDPPPGSLPGD